MNALLRVLPLALGALLPMRPLHAGMAPAEFPSIFSDVAPRRLAPPRLIGDATPSHVPLSDKMRAALLERVAERSGGLPIAVRPPTQHWALAQGDAILMDSYIVNVPSEKKVEIQRSPNSLAHLWTTGELYPFGKGAGSPQLMLSLGQVRLPAIGTASTAPRVELSMVWHW